MSNELEPTFTKPIEVRTLQRALAVYLGTGAEGA